MNSLEKQKQKEVFSTLYNWIVHLYLMAILYSAFFQLWDKTPLTIDAVFVILIFMECCYWVYDYRKLGLVKSLRLDIANKRLERRKDNQIKVAVMGIMVTVALIEILSLTSEIINKL